MKITAMDDETAAQTLLEAYRSATSAYDPDNKDHGKHPSHDVNRWIRIAATGGTNSERDIEARDEPAESNMDPQATDDPPEFPGRPAQPANRNTRPAQDSRPLRADEVVRAYRAQQAADSLVEFEDDGITVRPRRSRY